MDGLSLTVGGSLGAAIVSAIVKIWSSRNAKTEIATNPVSIEQSAYQAKMKENDKDHENLFARVATVEQAVARIDAKVDAKFDSITEQLRETKDMVRQLFERIIGGKRK